MLALKFKHSHIPIPTEVCPVKYCSELRMLNPFVMRTRSDIYVPLLGWAMDAIKCHPTKELNFIKFISEAKWLADE